MKRPSITVVFVLLSSLYLVTSPSLARTWTCDATIALTGSSFSYTVPTWNESGGPLVDREKKCKNDIIDTWFKTGAIWKKLGMNATDQNTWCRKGTGTFRIDYGFDKRKKDWSMVQTIPTHCICSGNMAFE